ncbi:MAG TPA: UDP-N-acetylmuramoyl-tripeptide--D-alanyl-D-alanine ligase [Candidatus Binataceae bacterium]|nr:UDP-N-acetylmuramoyl-tripeptide--D-alanyl-D-alanine ligase [Candidatus Binataceae bacterium]
MATPIPANRCAFTAEEIIRATDARPSGPGGVHVESVSIDTRSIAPGALFVALRGGRDGHQFLRAAAARGAAAAIVEGSRADPALPCFEVGDTLEALGRLARLHLRRRRAAAPLPVIAVGGAAGKTTTKEMTAALMRALVGRALATPGNLNNLIGVPMTIFTLSESDRAAVIECGTNQRGEIRRLADIVAPDAALVLNADIEHTEGLGSLEGVADEEASLFTTARVAVVNSAEPMILARVPAAMRMVRFGDTADADVRLLWRRTDEPGRQEIAIELGKELAEAGAQRTLRARLHLIGAASALNATAAVAAVAAALAHPLSGDEIAALGGALESVRAVDGRLSTRALGGVVVIDDSYNANPRSVRAALAAARETADGLGARLIVALGDMLELGELSAEMHRQALRDVVTARPAALIAVGPEMNAAILADRIEAPAIVHSCADSPDAAAIVRSLARPGDVLLVKGSRGVAMERVIAGLE